MINGTVNGGASGVLDRNGNLNSAMTFDGVDDNITVDAPQPTIITDITMGLWVKQNPIGASPESLFEISNMTGFTTGRDAFGFQYQSGGLGFFWLEGAGGNIRYLGSSIADGTWHHLVGVPNSASSQLEIYLDGVIINTFSFTRGFTMSALRYISIGGGYGTNYSNAELDDAFIYDRAQSASEINDIYNAQSCFLEEEEEEEIGVPTMSSWSLFILFGLFLSFGLIMIYQKSKAIKSV